jgi:bacillopeptidase F (M6 metalloprotease family)
MNAMELQLSFFEDNSDQGLLRQEFLLLHASTEKVRRGCFAKVTAQQKQIEALKSELEAIKQFIGYKNDEKNNLDSADLPILQFA